MTDELVFVLVKNMPGDCRQISGERGVRILEPGPRNFAVIDTNVRLEREPNFEQEYFIVDIVMVQHELGGQVHLIRFDGNADFLPEFAHSPGQR